MFLEITQYRRKIVLHFLLKNNVEDANDLIEKASDKRISHAYDVLGIGFDKEEGRTYTAKPDLIISKLMRCGEALKT